MKLIIGCKDSSGAGPLVAKRLQALGLNAVIQTGDGLDLLDLWDGADDVIVVDVIVGDHPGRVRTWNPREAEREHGRDELFACSRRAFSIRDAVRFAKILNTLPKRIKIYGIEVLAVDHEGVCPPQVLEAVDAVVDEILGHYPLAAGDSATGLTA